MRSNRINLKFVEDMARAASGAFGSFEDIRKNIKNMVREGVEQMMSEMDMVTRAEFERVEAMAQKARTRQEELEKRLAALEGKKTKGKSKKTTKTKTKNKK